MKKFIQYISAGLFCVIAFACKNDFLTNVPNLPSISVASEIVVSPNWEARDYSIQVPTAGDAGFTIVKTPGWFHVPNLSGQFANGAATINCSASVNNAFSEVGIYKSSILLNIEGAGEIAIPVSYIVEGDPVIETESDLTLSCNYTYYGSIPLVIKNNGQGILLWSMVEKPDWVSFTDSLSASYPPNSSSLAIPPNGAISLTLLYNIQSLAPNADLTGRIRILSNDKNNGETVINVQCAVGDPVLQCSANQLDFGSTDVIRSLDISNQGSGLLMWTLSGCPEWLSVSETRGTLSPYSSRTLVFTCDRSLLPAGQQSQTIYLETNDRNNPSYAITITAGDNPVANIQAIEGTVTDAWLDKTTNILYLTTSGPDRLLAYNTTTKTIERELALDRAPTCLSVSETDRSIIVGHEGMIIRVDPDNFYVTKTIALDFNIFDIEWGVDNWCCYTWDEDSNYNLHWINLDTEETYETPSYGLLFGKLGVKKIPHQDYIVASRLSNSPSSILVFSTREPNLVHAFGDDIGSFWFSSDGNYLFSSKNQIYETSSLTSSDSPSLVGNFSPAPSSIYWIDHHADSQSVWVLAASSEGDDLQREIRQYNDRDYTLVNTYRYGEYYEESPARAQYVFVNSTGNELFIIKNNDLNAWSVEYIPVTR